VRKAWRARDVLRVGPDKVESRVEIRVVSLGVGGFNSVECDWISYVHMYRVLGGFDCLGKA